MEKGLYYLASPHKGTSEQEARRFEVSLKLTTEFLTRGIYVFSPIVYSKNIANALSFLPLEERRHLVLAYLLDFLKVSKGLILVTMDGWQESWGVRQELMFCQKHHIPVYSMVPDQVPEDFSQFLSTPLDQKQIIQLLEAA